MISKIRLSRLLSQVFLIAGAVSMAVMAASYFMHSGDTFMSRNSLSSEIWFVYLFKSHIATGIIAILTGIFQFFPSIRKRWIHVHRLVGKLYVGSIFFSATCGLILAQFAFGGLITRIGFSILSVLWFYFTYLAFNYARKGMISLHKEWMFRSYALTFSSLTLRIFLLTALFTSIPFTYVYQFASWGCWITNLIVCERIISNFKKSSLLKV